MRYIYYALGFDREEERYTVLLNNDTYDESLYIKNVMARKIDTMLSEFFPQSEIQIEHSAPIEADAFSRYLSNKYLINISQHLCTGFDRDEEITIIKQKIPPLEDKNLDAVPDDQC